MYLLQSFHSSTNMPSLKWINAWPRSTVISSAHSERYCWLIILLFGGLNLAPFTVLVSSWKRSLRINVPWSPAGIWPTIHVYVCTFVKVCDDNVHSNYKLHLPRLSLCWINLSYMHCLTLQRSEWKYCPFIPSSKYIRHKLSGTLFKCTSFPYFSCLYLIYLMIRIK